MQYARQGIRVNALCPGPVNTPLLQELFAKDPERAARRLVHVPMGRFAEPEELAAAVAFLASDDASFITGVDLPGRRRHQPATTSRRCKTMTARPGRSARRARHCCARCGPGTPFEDTVGRLLQTIRLGVLAAGRVAAARTRTRGPARRQPRHRPGGDQVAGRRRLPGVAARPLRRHVLGRRRCRRTPATVRCDAAPRSTTRCGCARSSRSGAARMAASRTLTAAEREVLWSRLTDVRGAPARRLPAAGLAAASGDRRGGRIAVAGAAGRREPDAAERAARPDSVAGAQYRALRRTTRGDRDGDPGRRQRGRRGPRCGRTSRGRRRCCTASWTEVAKGLACALSG